MRKAVKPSRHLPCVTVVTRLVAGIPPGGRLAHPEGSSVGNLPLHSAIVRAAGSG